MQGWLAKIAASIGIEALTRLGQWLLSVISKKATQTKVENVQEDRDKIYARMQEISNNSKRTAGEILELKELTKKLRELDAK